MNYSNNINIPENSPGNHRNKICALTSSLVVFVLASCAVSQQNSDEPQTEIPPSTLLIPFQSLDDILAGKSPNIGKSFYPEMQISLEKANQESQRHVDDNNIVIEE